MDEQWTLQKSIQQYASVNITGHSDYSIISPPLEKKRKLQEQTNMESFLEFHELKVKS